MTISATIPVAFVGAANTELEGLGFGPDNFSIATRDGSAGATHAGLHHWNADDACGQAIQALDYVGLEVLVGQGATVNFQDHCDNQSLEWSDPADWFENPVMIGDQRTYGGKLWESLVDYNVWEPPIGWREIVSEGYPDWVQPTGAHDAYALGDRVTHNGSDWESTTPANVWEPGVFGWIVI